LKFKVTLACPKDLDLLASHRQKMWGDIHPEWKSELRDSYGFTRRWIKRKLADKKLVGFIARADDGAVAGSGCIWIREEQPRPTNPRLEVPYLMSMYTERAYRRKGVARLVVRSALKWCREMKYERVILHASAEGKPLYLSLGFETANEMRLKL
jgi:GNAT superfamily N-acetyltransferase